MKKTLQITSTILLCLLLFQVYTQTAILTEFPLGFNNDMSSHMAKLHLIQEYSYNDVIPHWYNGFEMFARYPPGWFYVALPFLYILNNVELATLASMCALVCIAAGLIWHSKKKWSTTQKLALFTFTFANPLALGNFIRIGRYPELTAWVAGLAVFLLLDHYIDKEKPISFYILFTICYAATILSHPAVALVISILIASFWLAQNNKDKVAAAVSTLIALAATAFWWKPFLANSANITQYVEMLKTIELTRNSLPDVITTIITPLILIIAVYHYALHTRHKQRLIMYSLPTIIAILVLTRIIIIIPGLSTIQPDTYNIFFILLATNLFVQTTHPRSIRKYIPAALITTGILCVIATVTLIPPIPGHTIEDTETLELLNHVDGKLAIVSHPTSYEGAIYSYGAIYNNISTHEGWVYQYREPYIELATAELTIGTQTGNCTLIEQGFARSTVQEIIAPQSQCEALEACGYTLKKETTSFCLYKR